jgi:glycosyltransferase involved in cell wall biosynthesis
MNKQPVVLLVYPADNSACKTFAASLRESITGFQTLSCEAKLSTLLLDSRKADLLHFVLPPASKLLPLAKKIGAKKHALHTLVAVPRKDQKYRDVLCARQCVVFTQQEKKDLQASESSASVQVIGPCKNTPDENGLHSAAHFREQYAVGDRLLVASLSDITSRPAFDAFLYISREYNRRGGFRFLIPQYDHSKETSLWRGRLQQTIEQEKLSAVTLLPAGSRSEPLLLSADFAVHLEREPNDRFGLSLEAVDFLMRGKPVFCFNQPSLNEVVYQFQPRWVATNIEDIVRASRDLRKDQAQLPQISAKLSGYANDLFHPQKVASRYQEIYHHLLGKTE